MPITLTDREEQPLDDEQKLIKINSNQRIEFDSSTYTGGLLEYKVKAITPYGIPVFKLIIIEEVIATKGEEQSLDVNKDDSDDE